MRRSFSFLNGSCGVALLAAHLVLLRPALAATPSEEYLAVRREFPPRPGITLSQLGQTPDQYRGVTVEIEGRLVGIARGGEVSSLMIATENEGTVTIPLHAVPEWLQAGEHLRALITVGAASASGRAPQLEVRTIASASDIFALEERAKARAAAEAVRKAPAKTPARPLADQVAALGIKGQPVAKKAPAARPAAPPRYVQPKRVASARPSLDARSAVISRSLSPNAQAVYEPYRAAIRGFNRRLSEREVDAITSSILLYSERLDVDPRLVIAVIIAESSFNPSATSRTGAMGLGQIMPGTAREIGLSNPYDPVENIYGAVYLLKQRLQKYSGGAPQSLLEPKHIILALAAYNAGMGAVKKYGGVPPYRETQRYVKKVEQIYRKLCSGETS